MLTGNFTKRWNRDEPGIEASFRVLSALSIGMTRRLGTIAAAAALLGLAASAWVRTHVSTVARIMMPALLRTTKADKPTPSPGAGRSTDVSESESTMVSAARGSELERTGGKHRGRRTRPASVQDAFSENLGRGICKLSEYRYEIRRSTLDLALGNLGFLSRYVRVAVALRDDKPLGFRLFAIRADGPIAKLGLRNGDVLVSVNGLDIATPDRALDAYSKLRTAKHLVLGLMRDGRELRHEYSVR
jgi:hypothetical protein